LFRITTTWDNRQALERLANTEHIRRVVNETLEQAAQCVASYVEDETTNIPKVRVGPGEFTYEMDMGSATLTLTWQPEGQVGIEVQAADERNRQIWNQALERAIPEVLKLFSGIYERILRSG
jgi:hypothetical protein